MRDAVLAGAGDDQQDVQQSGEPQEPIAPVTRSPRPGGSRSRAGSHSSERERLLLRAVDEVEVRLCIPSLAAAAIC